MLPFFARTLTRREMALGCAVLSLALLLSALPAAPVSYTHLTLPTT